MVRIGPRDKRKRIVLFASFATSIVLMNLFLFGAIVSNMVRGVQAYTQVDMAAGSIFVFVISMIISLSLWPKIMDKLEQREMEKEA